MDVNSTDFNTASLIWQILSLSLESVPVSNCLEFKFKNFFSSISSAQISSISAFYFLSENMNLNSFFSKEVKKKFFSRVYRFSSFR